MNRIQKIVMLLALAGMLAAPSTFAWCNPWGCHGGGWGYHHYYHPHYYHGGWSNGDAAAVGLFAGAAIGMMAGAAMSQPQTVVVNRTYYAPAGSYTRTNCWDTANGYRVCRTVHYYN